MVSSSSCEQVSQPYILADVNAQKTDPPISEGPTFLQSDYLIF